MKRKKRRTLNAVVDDEQNLLDAIDEYRARKNEERENLCCGNALSVAVEGFCVDHFLFNGSLSLLSPSYILSCYQSINARRIHTTREERKFVLEPFVRLSVHLSILCCLSSVTLLLCMCAYVRVYTFCSHLLSFPLALLCLSACTHARIGGRKVVQRSLSLSHILPAAIVHSLVQCKDQNFYIRIRQAERQTSLLLFTIHVFASQYIYKRDGGRKKKKSIDLSKYDQSIHGEIGSFTSEIDF